MTRSGPRPCQRHYAMRAPHGIGAAVSRREIIAMFVGIPIAVCVGVGTLVFWLTENRVPDGLAAARERDSSSATAAAQNEPGSA